MGLAPGAVAQAGGQAPAEPPQFAPMAGCGQVTYVPAKLMTCRNGRCHWHDPEPAQAYLFTDPVFCFGSKCPPGTIGQGGKVRM
ncbi:MAG TPA: hypothetical protein VHP58_04860 [Alphaproteobacteria bacterium]|nr:hypothetical protein [Alphaproteobacteria bacterium]